MHLVGLLSFLNIICISLIKIKKYIYQRMNRPVQRKVES